MSDPQSADVHPERACLHSAHLEHVDLRLAIPTTSYDSLSSWQDQQSVQLSGAGSALPLLTSEVYSGAAGAKGLLTGATLGGFSGGATGSYSASYDALGRMTDTRYTLTPSGGATTPLYEVQPTYDALGNVIESVTTLPQGVDTQVFCYDDLARLTWAGSSGTPGCSGAPTPSDTGSLAGTGAQYSASYTYDSLNRLTSSPLGAYTYGDSAHADAATAIGSGGSAWTASYDTSGNLTCRAASGATTCSGATPTGATLAYDNQGQLAQWLSAPTSPTSSATYLYDGEGHRIQQVTTTSGTTTTSSYLGSLEEITTDGATTTTTAYYGGLALSVNGALSYTLSDGLGSVSASVNASSGVVSASQLYGPYGAVRYQSGALPTSYGYTHQRSDAISGLDYYNARYYDPLAGQFTSADTTLAGGLNRYAYVGGNPETWVDPNGHAQREGGEGEAMIVLGGDGNDVGAGGVGGETSGGGNDPVLPPTYNGSETTYGAGTDGAIHFDVQNGQIDGVDGPDGQVLETNAQIEAQAEADANDVLHQGDIHQAETNAQNGKNTTSPNDTSTPATPNDSNATNSGAAQSPTPLSPSSIRYSQSSVNGASEIIRSMQANGWVGDPIDVVQMPDGGLTTVDNTRVVAANEAGIEAQAMIHQFDEPLPEEQVGRFTTRKGGVPSTWGDAISNRIGGQNATFRENFPYGAPFITVKG